VGTEVSPFAPSGAESVEAILWDNDGVLIDTEEIFFSATCDALASAGVILSREFYLECVLGNGRSVFDLLKLRGWTPQECLQLRRERDAAYAHRLESGCQIIEGVPETLKLLRERFRMAVVTTALRAHFNIAHQGSGLLEFFELIVAREDYTEAKPHPEPYLTALKLLGVRRERCVAVEDSTRGLNSALAAGLRTIVIPSRLTRASVFKGAVAVLDSITAIPDVLAAL
jgi:HAD superfamily hydrolase (TIGR01509 family)